MPVLGCKNRMKKTEALILAEKKYGFNLNNENSHFSSVNSAKPVWWFEIPLSKIENNEFQFINLVAEQSGDILLFQVPVIFFRDNLSGFKFRPVKQMICLEIDIFTFQNRVGPARQDFKQFLLEKNHQTPTNGCS